jgi:hypothetical protein
MLTIYSILDLWPIQPVIQAISHSTAQVDAADSNK